MSDLDKTGVYVIEHVKSGKKYVGSTSKSFRRRWREHRERLKKGTHTSTRLMNAWKKYGESSFEFRILEITKPEYAVAVEQTFIDWYKSADQKYGFNISPTAGSPLGSRRSQETRNKQSILKSTPEARERARLNMLAKHADPVFAEQRDLRMRALQADPVFAANQVERARNQMLQRHSDPDWKAAHAEWSSKSMKLLNADPEFRKKEAERKKSERFREALKAGHARRKANMDPKEYERLKQARLELAAAGRLRSKLKRASQCLVVLSEPDCSE